MVTIERLTVDDAKKRQAEILAEVGLSADELLEGAERYELDTARRILALEYERLSFLLTGE